MRFFLVFLFCISALTSFGQKDYKKSIKKHRKTYKKDFAANERAPLNKKEVRDLSFFPADADYKISGKFSPTPDAKPFEMATYSGITKPYKKYGTISFNLKGQDLEIAVYQSLKMIRMPQYRDHLFIPFKDLTNDESTYGGGRYIDIKKSDISKNMVTIDFNKAYNPWCAYSDGYSCPVPPIENHLQISLEAGEKKYTGAYKGEKH